MDIQNGGRKLKRIGILFGCVMLLCGGGRAETVLVLGLANGRHPLTIRNPHGDLGVTGFVVNKPAPK